MKSPAVENIVRKISSNLREDAIREFINDSFNSVAKSKNLTAKDFQKRAIVTGTTFQYCFKSIMERFYPDIADLLTHDHDIPKACFTDGGKADFALHDSEGKLIVFEAKGSAGEIIGINGTKVRLNSPGMKRTDTVKKAVCNAYQLKKNHPNSLYFIVTSHKPLKGNAKCICDIAEGDIVDKIVDVTSKDELDSMVGIIKSRL